MQQYPKNIKRLLREYMAEAYERELHRELKRDEIPAELLEAISSLLAFYQSLKEESELKEPGE